MASPRTVDDILANLLAADEGVESAAQHATPQASSQQQHSAATAPLQPVKSAFKQPDVAAANSQTGASSEGLVEVDLLLQDLLASSQSAAGQPKLSASDANTAAETLHTAVNNPAADEEPLIDLLDSSLTVMPTSGPSNGLAASALDAMGDYSASGWPANSKPAGLHQQHFEASVAASRSAAHEDISSTLGADNHVHASVQQTATSLAVPTQAVEDSRPTAVAVLSATAEAEAEAEAADSAGDDSDSDMFDMLHDMAEVLEGGAAADTDSSPHATAAVASAANAAESVDSLTDFASSCISTASSDITQQVASSMVRSDSAPQQQEGQRQLLLSQQATQAAATTSPATAFSLPACETALQEAWEYEEQLYHGELADSHSSSNHLQQQQQGRRPRLEPLTRLTELLSDARQDWNPAGRPDASGNAMIGGAVLLKLESLAGLFAAAAGMGAGGRSSSGGGLTGGSISGDGVDWTKVLGAALAPHGLLQVVAASGPYLAVGSVLGSALLFQLPTPQQGTAGQQGLAAATSHQNPGHHQQQQYSTLPGGAAMWQLGEGLTGDAVTCLGFSVVMNGSDALWLAVGHESGALSVWELQKKGPRQVAVIAQHGARLTLASFPPGRGTSVLLSGDVRGRLCIHTFSNLLLRTNVSSKVLVSGQYGALLGISHLTPFAMPAPALPKSAPSGTSPRQGPDTASVSPVGTGRFSPKGLLQPGGGSRGATPPLSPKPGAPGGGGAAAATEAAWKAYFEDGMWRVGEGLFCLLTPNHVYIARIKPNSNDLIMLFSIPQPTPGPQAAVPVAAWLPHYRKPTAAGYRMNSSTTSGGGSPSSASSGSSDPILMPVAVLALGWGSRLVMFEVPLIGDHVSVAAAVVPEAPASAATALAAAAGQLRRGSAGSMTSSRAAQKAQQTLEALTAATKAQLAAHFVLSITGAWTGGPEHDSSGNAAQGSSASSGVGIKGNSEVALGPKEPLPILGAHWLDADAVAIVCQQGFSSLLLVLGYSAVTGDSQAPSQVSSRSVLRVQEQVEWMDQPVDRQWGLSGGLAAWGCDCGGSVVGAGSRMYLLGQQGGLYCGRLMPWSERLKTLQDVRKFKLGLYYALRFQQASQQCHQQQQLQGSTEADLGGSSWSSSGGAAAAAGGGKSSAGAGLARSEGLGAEPQQIEQWMLSLTLGHATATLQEAATTHHGQLQQQVPWPAVHSAAEVCVCACLMLSRVDVLFQRVYPLFARPDLAGVGAVGVFVEVLESAVLSDLLESLPPEVMQALVDHFAGVGQPERVERCVLHLSITSLDLNQVIRLCEEAGLYSALTFIYNHIGDYRKPLLDILSAVAAASSFCEAHRYSCKLLVYLRCCVRGLKFPPGTGHLPSSPLGVLDSIKSTLLGSLLFLDTADLIAEWQQSGGRAAAAAAALTNTSSSGSSVTKSRMLYCRTGLSDPHPALQLLLGVDVAAVVAVLSEMTAGWDAVETDLRAAAGKPAAELESVLVATQVVVNAIVALLEAGKFEQWDKQRISSSSSSSTGQPSGSSVAVKYVTELLAAGRVTVKPQFAVKLLGHLTEQAAAALGTNSSSSNTIARDLEQQFIAIVNVVDINAPIASSVQQQQQKFDSSSLTGSQAQAVLNLALQAGFLRAAATVHHLQGKYQQAIAAYLKLTGNTQERQQQQQHGQRAAVFDYLERSLSSMSSSSSDSMRQAFMAAVLHHVQQLIQVDAAATAALLLRHQPDSQVPVLISLQQQPELQFKFLRAAMQQAMLLQQQQQAAAAAVDMQESGLPAGNASAVTAADKLLDRSEVADLYVRLLSRFDPAAVLPFLQSHHNYNVAAAIKACAAAGVSDAEAFLHERMGDLDAALRLYQSAMQAANAGLAAALLSGSIPVMQVSLAIKSEQAGATGQQQQQQQQQQQHTVHWGLIRFLNEMQIQTTAQTAGAADEELQQLQSAAAIAAGALLQLLNPAAAATATAAAYGCKLVPAASNASSVFGQQQQGRQDSGALPAATAYWDLHKAWMAELSPRLRVKGLGMSSSSSSSSGVMHHSQAAAAAISSFHGSNSSNSSHAAVSAAAAVVLPDVPSELMKAWQALQSGIAFCQRNTRSSSSSTGNASSSRDRQQQGEAGDSKQLWFSLMDVYVAKLKNIPAADTTASQDESAIYANSSNSSSSNGQQTGTVVQQQQRQPKGSGPLTDQELLSSLAAAAAGTLALDLLPPLLLRAAAAAAAAVSRDVFHFLLDELVCVMADHVPLLDIVSRVLQQHGSEPFGEFRSTLLGLFGATAFESAIMTAANRLITSDAFSAVRKAYCLRQLARQAHQEQQQQQQSAADTQPTELLDTTVAAAPVTTLSSSSALRTAHALGVLGRIGSSSSGSSSSSGAHRLTQNDKDLLMGILGPAALHLNLQPAGPAAAHLAGVAAEYRAAAALAERSKRPFKGEIDLAVELSLLHQQQQGHQQQQHQYNGAHVGRVLSRQIAAGGLTDQQQASVDEGAAVAGVGARESFDIDELLDWSQENLVS